MQASGDREVWASGFIHNFACGIASDGSETLTLLRMSKALGSCSIDVTLYSRTASHTPVTSTLFDELLVDTMAIEFYRADSS